MSRCPKTLSRGWQVMLLGLKSWNNLLYIKLDYALQVPVAWVGLVWITYLPEPTKRDILFLSGSYTNIIVAPYPISFMHSIIQYEQKAHAPRASYAKSNILSLNNRPRTISSIKQRSRADAWGEIDY